MIKALVYSLLAICDFAILIAFIYPHYAGWYSFAMAGSFVCGIYSLILAILTFEVRFIYEENVEIVFYGYPAKNNLKEEKCIG